MKPMLSLEVGKTYYHENNYLVKIVEKDSYAPHPFIGLVVLAPNGDEVDTRIDSARYNSTGQSRNVGGGRLTNVFDPTGVFTLLDGRTIYLDPDTAKDLVSQITASVR